MKIELTVTLPSCPLQVEGTFGGYGVYYRAQNRRYQIWLNPDGLADYDWLSEGERPYLPTVEREIAHRYDDSLPYALHVIAAAVQDAAEYAAVEDAEHGFLEDIKNLERS